MTLVDAYCFILGMFFGGFLSWHGWHKKRRRSLGIGLKAGFRRCMYYLDINE